MHPLGRVGMRLRVCVGYGVYDCFIQTIPSPPSILVDHVASRQLQDWGLPSCTSRECSMSCGSLHSNNNHVIADTLYLFVPLLHCIWFQEHGYAYLYRCVYTYPVSFGYHLEWCTHWKTIMLLVTRSFTPNYVTISWSGGNPSAVPSLIGDSYTLRFLDGVTVAAVAVYTQMVAGVLVIAYDHRMRLSCIL